MELQSCAGIDMGIGIIIGSLIKKKDKEDKREVIIENNKGVSI